MKLELLLEREPFADVFIKTFKAYLISEFGWSGIIHWEPYRLAQQKNALLANGKLNIIYPQSLTRSCLLPVIREYAYNPNPLLSLLQSAYVRFGTYFPLEWFATTAVVKIDPWPKQIEKLCVIPGNHSIRIIDLDRDLCHVLLKHGFNKNFLLNEISVRQKFPFLPSPKLIDADKQSGRYTEERIEALPWDRISDHGIKKNALIEAQQALAKLYGETKKACQVSERIDELNAKLQIAVNSLPPCFTPTEVDQIFSLENKLNGLIADSKDQEIETAQSHGDFQPANIMVSVGDGSNKLYLIDWEYSEQRYCIYDAMVFVSRSRAPIGLSNRLIHLLKEGVDYSSLWSWRFDKPESKIRGWMVALFLMEDLLVRIQEMNIPELKNGDKGLRQFLAEAATWTDCVK